MEPKLREQVFVGLYASGRNVTNCCVCLVLLPGVSILKYVTCCYFSSFNCICHVVSICTSI